MIKITVCDDDPDVLDTIVGLIKKNYGNAVSVSACSQVQRLVGDWQTSGDNRADIVIMDIVFEQDNGITAAKTLQQLSRDVKVIFISGYLEYAADIFEADPFYFLVKPIKEKKLVDAVNRALEKIREEDRNCLLLQSRGEIVKVKIDDIWYVESSRRNLTIYEAGESSRVLMKLSDMEKLLPEYFLRCHQSYLVNLDRIKKFTLDGIVLIDGRVIPVSRARYSETKDKFLQILGERLI
ncbi:LytR/AlgR family response regulator transcription factor [Eisenbergiella sp.]